MRKNSYPNIINICVDVLLETIEVDLVRAQVYLNLLSASLAVDMNKDQYYVALEIIDRLKRRMNDKVDEQLLISRLTRACLSPGSFQMNPANRPKIRLVSENGIMRK